MPGDLRDAYDDESQATREIQGRSSLIRTQYDFAALYDLSLVHSRMLANAWATIPEGKNIAGTTRAKRRLGYCASG